jgi:uncharacterized protein (TIGR02996 family)
MKKAASTSTTDDLRQAWAQWRDFTDALTITDADPDACKALHGRVFRLCGKHPLKARHLAAVRDQLRAALEPWLGEDAAPPADDLARLARTADACFPAWEALFVLKLKPGRESWWHLQLEAEKLGLTWKREFWQSAFFNDGFDPLTATSAWPREQALATLTALWETRRHEKGEPFWKWLSGTGGIWVPHIAFIAAAVLAEAANAAVLTAERLRPLQLDELVTQLPPVLEEFCLRCLRKLNEDVPIRGPALPRVPGKRPQTPRAVYRREPPDPLPIEPYFKKIRGAEAFLRAIAEEPLEDSHRLAFADWLDEHDHAARAEFIRLQCQRASLPSFHPLREWCEERIGRLLKDNAAEWMQGLDYGPGKPWNHGSFRRGMLERIDVDAGEGCDAVYAALKQADVRGVSLDRVDERALDALTGQEWLSRLTSLRVTLRITPWGTDDRVRAFARSPGLSNLTELDLFDSDLGSRYLVILFENLPSPPLTALGLEHNNVSTDAATALAGSRWFANVRELDVSRTFQHFTAAALRALVSSENAANLTALKAYLTSINAGSIEALANSPFMANLATLCLNYNHVGSTGTRSLVKSPFLKSLTALDLGSAQLKAESVRTLVRSELFTRLRLLDLSLGKYTDDALKQLAAAPESVNLTALSLAYNDLDDGTAAALASSPLFRHLTALDVSNVKMSDTAVKSLLASPELTKLVHLDLRESAGGPLKKALMKRWPFVLV